MATPHTVLFQVPNQVGLGHMVRAANIALALQSMAPDIRCQFVVDGSSHSVLEQLALAVISLPPLSMYNNDRWGEHTTANIYTALSKGILDAYQPSLIVYDCLPHLQFAEAAQQRGIPAALCIRKVKNFYAYSRFPNVAPLLAAASAILVPHEAREFPLPSHLLPKTSYVGPIVRLPGPPDTSRQASARSPRIVITGGGGGHPSTAQFYDLALSALQPVLEQRQELTALLVAGPLFRDWRSLRLFDRVFVSPFEPEMDEILKGASLVISHGGYNALAEVSRAEIPVICVPQPRRLDDQLGRAELYAAQHESFTVYAGSRPSELSALIAAALSKGVVSQASALQRSTPPGARTAATVLLRLLGM